MRPYLLFFLTGARIQLPLINPGGILLVPFIFNLDVLYLPYRRLMHTVPTETVQKMEEVRRKVRMTYKYSERFP